MKARPITFCCVSVCEIAALIPFQRTIISFEEALRRMETVDPQRCAGELVKLTTDVTNAKSAVASLKAPPRC